jgi:hypothetical protein
MIGMLAVHRVGGGFDKIGAEQTGTGVPVSCRVAYCLIVWPWVAGLGFFGALEGFDAGFEHIFPPILMPVLGVMQEEFGFRC